MRSLIVASLLFTIFCLNGYAQVADTVSLNGSWKFKTDRYDKGVEQQWFRSGLDDAKWDRMEVPGNWDLHNEYDHYMGKAWYRTSFKVPDDWEDKNVRLVFGGVYNDAQIWLNGQKIGKHSFGYRLFYFDINAYLKPGKSNELVLQVDNTFKRGAIWNWGGIRRPVWLEVTNKVRLDLLHITAVPDLKKGSANINVDFEVNNKTHQDENIAYQVRILRKDKEIWNSSQQKSGANLIAQKDGITKGDMSFKLPPDKVALWSFNDPNLYEAEIQISRDGKVLHRMKDHFGIRKIEVDGEQLKLNGKPVRPVGFNLVPEDRTTGSTLPLWRIKKDVDMMKALGANMARLSHLPLPKSFLDYLDEKGFMTVEEVTLWGKDRWVDPEAKMPKYLLKSMIRQEYNHPSIIGWSVGNEIGYTNRNPKVMAYVEQATARVRKLDPTRLAEYISNSAQNQKTDPVQFVDMILQNSYGGWGKVVDRSHAYHPGKPIFMSEIGNQLNDEDPNKGTIDAGKMLGAVRHKPYFIGTSLWTFNDYRSTWKSSPTWTTPPSENRAWGIVNVFRQKKRAYYTFRREYLPFETVKLHNNTDRLEPEQKITTTVTLNPRDSDDFPIYEMNNYKISWRVENSDEKITGGGYKDLPEMQAGSKPYSTSFKWEIPEEGGQAMRISILDPQSYAIFDTTFYLQPPVKPKILSVHTGVQGIRVTFNKESSATHYKLKYGVNSLDKETDPTIDNFVNIENLKNGQTYKVQLVAINNAGETATETFNATIDEDELPPVIWHTEPSDSSFFVGYSVDKADLLYEIEYGTKPVVYTDTLTLQTKGVCQIPDLKEGQTYYYRFRRRRQWGFASDWTREISVKTDGGINPQSPFTHGGLRNSDTALLIFDPVHKANGYNIKAVPDNGSKDREIFLNAGYVNYALIKGLDPNLTYNYYIQSITDEGKSGFIELSHIIHNF